MVKRDRLSCPDKPPPRMLEQFTDVRSYLSGTYGITDKHNRKPNEPGIGYATKMTVMKDIQRLVSERVKIDVLYSSFSPAVAPL